MLMFVILFDWVSFFRVVEFLLFFIELVNDLVSYFIYMLVVYM